VQKKNSNSYCCRSCAAKAVRARGQTPNSIICERIADTRPIGRDLSTATTS
jgi:hypothetical protein